jgi:hypothetical protein
MDQSYLLLLALSMFVALAALGAIRAQSRSAATPGGPDSRLGVSTEGMKVCPHCRMGNFWAERTCSACGRTLKS